jgi:nitrous oxide reductase accessory protein NosL
VFLGEDLRMKRFTGMLLALLLAVGILAGCGGGQKVKPALDFTLEQTGEGVVVHMQATNFQVGKDGHFHLYLDDGPQTMAYSNTYTFPKLSPGKHKVTVGLSDLKHLDMGVTQSKEIEVK